VQKLLLQPKERNYVQGLRPTKTKRKKRQLSIQVYSTKKPNFLVLPHFISLKLSFIQETKFPRVKGGVASVKDEVIPFFPDLPSPQDEDFHEEIVATHLPCLFHHRVELKIESLVDI
jgi:hypothetical protein